MAFKTTGGVYASSSIQATLDKIKDIAVSAGWTLHDDLSGSTPYAYVLKSLGESGTMIPCYLYIYEGTGRFEYYLYYDWNATTHAGNAYKAGASGYCYMLHAGTNNIWVSANKDCIACTVYDNSQYNCFCCSWITPNKDTPYGELQSAVSSGSNVVLSLDTGQAEGFLPGYTYQIMNNDNRGNYEVKSVDHADDEITMVSLPYSFAAGSPIGTYPYPWIIYNTRGTSYFTFRFNYTGSADDSAPISFNQNFLQYSYCDPETRSGRYMLWPLVMRGGSQSEGFNGFPNDNHLHMRFYGSSGFTSSASRSTFAVGEEYDSGTSTGSNTSTTLNDTGKSWTTDEHAGRAVVITSGTGAGSLSIITGNSGTALTVSPAWETTPASSDGYEICDEVWEYFYYYNSSSYAGAHRLA